MIHEGVIELPPTCPFLYVPPYSFQVQEDGPELFGISQRLGDIRVLGAS